MRNLTLLTFLISLTIQSTFSRTITSDDVDNANSHPDKGVWLSTFEDKFRLLFLTSALRENGLQDMIEERPFAFLDEAAKSETSVGEVKVALRVLYNHFRQQDIVKNGSNKMSNYLSPFVVNHKVRMGLSQAVLETGIACRIAPSANAKKEKLCALYPKLLRATTELLYEVLPQKNLGDASYLIPNHSSLIRDPHRGAIAGRALIPIYHAYKVFPISSAHRSALRGSVINIRGVMNNSLRDFYSRLLMNTRNSPSQTWGNRLSEVRGWPISTIVNRCKSEFPEILYTQVGYQVRAKKWYRRKCTSNHAVAMYLGRLMTADILGYSSFSGIHKREFSYLVNHTVYDNTHNGNSVYFFSDQFRTHDSSPSGIGYSMLQARLLVFGAEILMDHANLYTANNSKLLYALDRLHYVTNRKWNTGELYFDNISDRDAVFNFKKDRERYKYVKVTGDASLRWGRNHGFLLIPRKRFCGNAAFSSNDVSICRNFEVERSVGQLPSDLIPNSVPVSVENNKVNLIEDVHAGPTQLLFNRNF